jgi:hypothetical protein
MGDTGNTRCVGRGDGTDCPNGEDLDTGAEGPRCEECQHHYERDTTEPGRRPMVDDGLTRPMGDPDEAGHRGSAA